MFKSTLAAALFALLSTLSPVHAAEEASQTQQQPTAVPNPFDPSSWTNLYGDQAAGGAVNWFDPSTWSTGAATTTPMQFNPAHPAGWAIFFDPATHASAHRAFTNPATYAQFMTPQFYMQFMNPNNWLAWMNPASYSAFLNPANYLYWMNPGAYAHVMEPTQYFQGMNPANYAAFMNPMTYMQWMNPAAYSIPGVDVSSAGGFNWFDPATWGNVTQTQPTEASK